MGPFPKGVFLTKGVGKHREKLNSFELSLRSAGIAEFNLVHDCQRLEDTRQYENDRTTLLDGARA